MSLTPEQLIKVSRDFHENKELIDALILDWIRRGEPYSSIGRRFGVSDSVVSNHARRAGIRRMSEGDKPASTNRRIWVVRHLKEMIESGELKSGHVIPSQTRLAEQFNCSAGSVYNAMKDLCEEGVFVVRNRRTYVK